MFGNHPNKKNLAEFLRMEAIQYLWFGIHNGKKLKNYKGFRESRQLREFMNSFSTENKKLIYQFFRSIEPAGLSVLP